MTKKIVIAALLIILLTFAVSRYFSRDQYHESPENVVNKSIWFTTTQIEDLFREAVKNKVIDYDNLGRFLKLYGAFSQNFSVMLGEDKYPVFQNGFVVNEYLLKHKGGDLTATDWETVTRLATLYEELDMQQSLLINDSGDLRKEILSKLTELNNQITSLVR